MSLAAERLAAHPIGAGYTKRRAREIAKGAHILIHQRVGGRTLFLRQLPAADERAHRVAVTIPRKLPLAWFRIFSTVSIRTPSRAMPDAGAKRQGSPPDGRPWTVL